MQFLYKLAIALLAFFPVVFQLGVVVFYSQPLFLADDFHLLETIVRLQEPASLPQKLRWLIQQHNEHRILVPRLLTWLDYELEGYINWRVLMLIGNIIWCGILYFLWSAFRSLRLPVWYFLPVPWLLFHPIYYDNLTWTISVLQQSVIVFLLSWLVYTFSNRQFSLTVLIVLLATFTHGNGLLGFGLGIVFFVLYREWRWLALWSLLTVVTAGVYFYGFAKGQSADFGQSLADPLRAAAYFCAFLGTIVQSFGLYSIPSVVGGALLFAGLGGFLLSRLPAYFRSAQSLSYLDRMLLGNVLFMFVTALLVTISRSWMATNYLMPSRYAHYSPYLVAWFYLTVLSVLPQIRTWYGAVAGGMAALLVWGASYLNYFTQLEYRRDTLRADAANWTNYSFFGQYSPTFNHNIRPDFLDALKTGICRTPSYSGLPVHFAQVHRDSTFQFAFTRSEILMPNPDGDIRENILTMTNYSYPDETPFLVLLAEKKPPLWIPVYRMRNGYQRMITGQGLRKNEITATIFVGNYPAGSYSLGVYNAQGLALTPYHLEITPTHSVKVF